MMSHMGFAFIVMSLIIIGGAFCMRTAKTDESGKLMPKSGEYIVLKELATIGSIKMPKIRNWYYNKDDKFLGTDTLIEN